MFCVFNLASNLIRDLIGHGLRTYVEAFRHFRQICHYCVVVFEGVVRARGNGIVIGLGRLPR